MPEQCIQPKVICASSIKSALEERLKCTGTEEANLLTGSLRGWKDSSGFSVLRPEYSFGDDVRLMDNLGKVGCFLSSNSRTALSEQVIHPGTLTLLFYLDTNEGIVSSTGKSSMMFFYRNSPVSLEFIGDTEITRRLLESHVIFYSEIFPVVDCVSKEHDQEWTGKLKRKMNQWVSDHLNVNTAYFLVRNSKQPRVVSHKTKQITLAVLAEDARSNRLTHNDKKITTKSIDKETVVDIQKGMPPVICLELMQDMSFEKEPLSFRYEEVLAENKSVDDKKRQENANVYMIQMNCSVLTYVLKTDDHSTSDLRNAIEMHMENLQSSLSIQLELLGQENNGEWNAKFYRSYHIAPDFFHAAGCMDVVTLFYPPSSVQKTEQLRAKYKRILGFNQNSKALEHYYEIVFTGHSFETVLAVCTQANLTKEQGHLRDIHLLLNPPGKKFDVCTVRGSYDYYHYMQDRISDNGWGCAYRSMQTLVSWIIKQNLSVKSVPTHTEIQRMLVQMRDKPPSFVGSNRWIGAVEVSMCLSTHWNTTCKIIHVSSGREVENYADEIFDHFHTRGSPIMVGGGVLAYTLLGIAIDRLSVQNHGRKADIQYLILDPHYVGHEDPENIILKGYCRWKTNHQVWQDRHFYNFCLPLTPTDSGDGCCKQEDRSNVVY